MSPYALILLAASWSAAQAAPPPTDAEIQQAVEQLGADRAADREAATRRLWEIGTPAVPALRKAAESSDLEVVFRAKFLLEQIALGLGPDTPPETASLLRQVLHGDRPNRLGAARKLGETGQLAKLVELVKLEPDEMLRKELLAAGWKSGRTGLAAMLAGGDLDSVQQLLELGVESGDGARDLAVFLHLTARDLPPEGKSAVQAHLLLLRGDTGGALAIADRAGLRDIRTSILFDRGDYRAIGSWHTQEGGLESLGYAAALHRLQGDHEALAADVRRLVEGDLKRKEPHGDEGQRKILLLNDRFADGLALRLPPPDVETFELLRFQGRYREAFAVLGITPTTQDIVASLKELTAPGNDAETRDAARFGWGLEIARSLHALGEADRAKALLAGMPTLVEKHLKRPRYLSQLAKAEFDLGHVEQALARAAEVVSADDLDDTLGALFPDQGEAASLWWLFLKQRDPDAAPAATIEKLRRVMLLKPQPLEADELKTLAADAAATLPGTAQKSQSAWLGAIADACVVHGQRPLAVEILKTNIEHAPVSIRYLQGADLLAQEKRWADAAAWYRRAWDSDPNQYDAVFLEGYALQAAGQEAEGKARIGLARLLPLADGRRRLALADALRRRGLKDEAIREWELVLALGPFDDSATNDAAQQLGNAISGRDDLRCVSLWERLTVSLMAGNRFIIRPEGYLQLRHVVNKVRARGLLTAGKVDEAIEPVRLALAAQPDEIELAIELCPRLEAAGRKDVADEIFNGNYAANEAVLADFPRSWQHHNALAWLSARCQRRLDDALAHAKEATRLAPTSAACQDTLAEVHFQRGEKEQAIAAAKRTLVLSPGDKFFQSQLKRFSETAPPQR